MTRFTSAVIAILALSSGNNSRSPITTIAAAEELTFFDADFEPRRPGNNNNNNKGGGGKNPPANPPATATALTLNNTELYSHAIIGFSANTTLESPPPSTTPPLPVPPALTLSPTPASLHPLHDTPLPKNCARRFEQNLELTRACLVWMEKNPEFRMPSGSPTVGPSGGPSVWFGYSKEEVVVSSVSSVSEVVSSVSEVASVGDNGSENSNNEGANVGNSTGELIQSSFLNVIPSAEENDGANNMSSTVNSTTTTTKTTLITYKLQPQDDTFLELWRPSQVLGRKDKLKIDADEEGTPTKVILLKFGLGGVFGEMSGEDAGGEEEDGEATSSIMELTGASLQLYAMTDTTFGGYVSEMIPSSTNEDWNEESAVWSDYVGEKGGGGGGKNNQDKNNNNAVELLPSDEHPKLNAFGPISTSGGGKWVSTDLTFKLEDMFNGSGEKVLALRITTDSPDGVIYASKEHASGNGPLLELNFTLTSTTTTSSVAESVDGDLLDELMENQVVVNGTAAEVNATTVVPAVLDVVNPAEPTSSPSKFPTSSPLVPTPIVSRPFKPSMNEGGRTPIGDNNTGLVMEDPEESLVTDESSAATADESNVTDETAEESVVSTSTSVVSSSFRMTISAIETIRRRNNLRQLIEGEGVASSYPSIDNKERPAIIAHLTHVFDEVLSIAPTSISLVFEEDLVVEDLANSGEPNFGGMIRKSVFRVMAIFDDPADVSAIQSDDAAKVLDQATIYAFVGPEEGEFIKVLKSTGDLIVDGPAEYDVTVLKVNYLVGIDDELQGSSSAGNFDSANNANSSDGQENGGSSSSSSSSSEWLQPTLIAGASVLVVVSSAAGLLLWRQRHTDNPHGAHMKPEGDSSPRSLADATAAPSTPSPAVFMDRFKNKKTFDYAEFEDDDIDVEASDPSTGSEYNNAAISPLTANDNKYLTTATTRALSRRAVDRQHQQTKSSSRPTIGVNNNQREPTINAIKSFEFPNISFDDSSVSDVSAHLLGAKGSIKQNDPNGSQVESLLLDTTMDSYNMEAMSALDQVRFEDVMDGVTSSPTHYKDAGGGIAKAARDYDAGDEDGSLSTGAVPSELYSNLSIDSDLLMHNSHDTSGAAYGGHLFTLDMLRTKDSSLLEMPPPPSDAASDSSSQQDVGEDVADNSIAEPSLLIENAPMREKNEQDAVSQSINDELTKVMKLLKSPEELTWEAAVEEEKVGQNDVSRDLAPTSVDGSIVHIGTIENGTLFAAENDDDTLSGPTVANGGRYDGVNVLMNDESSTDAEPDENDPLKQMNNALSDCMDILEKARGNHKTPPSNSLYSATAGASEEKDASSEGNADIGDDQASFATQKLD